jgi:hypothetical protein
VVLNLFRENPSHHYTVDQVFKITGIHHNTAQRVINHTIPEKYGIEFKRRFVSGENFKEYWIENENKTENPQLPFKRNWRQSETPCPEDGSFYLEDGVCNLCLKAGRRKSKINERIDRDETNDRKDETKN